MRVGDLADPTAVVKEDCASVRSVQAYEAIAATHIGQSGSELRLPALGLRGIEINTHVNGKNLTDPSLGLEKFFRRVQELGIVLFMHPNGFTDAQRLTDHYFNNVIGNPMETTIAVSHLIFDGVMQRNPKLKIVLAHGGGYLAHYWARMDHAHRARPDCHRVIKRPPSSYLSRFYFDPITFDPEMLRHLIDKWGDDGEDVTEGATGPRVDPMDPTSGGAK